jgi:hypothetical protein
MQDCCEIRTHKYFKIVELFHFDSISNFLSLSTHINPQISSTKRRPFPIIQSSIKKSNDRTESSLISPPLDTQKPTDSHSLLSMAQKTLKREEKFIQLQVGKALKWTLRLLGLFGWVFESFHIGWICRVPGAPLRMF